MSLMLVVVMAASIFEVSRARAICTCADDGGGLKEKLEAAQRATFSAHICAQNIRRGRNAWNCSLFTDSYENL